MRKVRERKTPAIIMLTPLPAHDRRKSRRVRDNGNQLLGPLSGLPGGEEAPLGSPDLHFELKTDRAYQEAGSSAILAESCPEVPLGPSATVERRLGSVGNACVDCPRMWGVIGGGIY